MKTFAIFLSLAFIPVISGFSQWSTNPAQNNRISFQTGGEQVTAYASTHPSGITYISYFSAESGNYFPYIQKVNHEGYIQWQQNGIKVSSNASMTWITDYDMKVSHDTGVVIAFQDIRTGNNQIFVYKLNPQGQFLWGNNGIQLSNNADFNADPRIAVNSDNSAVVVWPRASNSSGDDVIMMQKITPGGQLAWTQPVTLAEAGFNYTWPRIVPAGNDNVIAVWYKEWGPYWAPNRIILAQKFNAQGTPVWPAPSVLFTGITPLYVHPLVTEDGNNGAYVCWFYEMVANHLSTFVNHVDNSGNVTMGANGTEASTNSSTLHLEPAIDCDKNTHEVYVFWRETNSLQSQFGLCGQKLLPDGTRMWGSNGKTFVSLSTNNVTIVNANAVTNGVITSYFYGGTTSSSVNAVKADSTGTTVWASPKNISTNSSGKDDLVNGGLHNGQIVFAWTDGRNSQNSIYSQNFCEDGSLGPVSQDITVTPDTLFFLTPDELITGKPFTIHNPNAWSVDVQYIQQSGIALPQWMVDPGTSVFPVTLSPGTDITQTVKWIIVNLDHLPTILYDTLRIYTVTDSVHVIIAVDSSLIGTGINKKDPVKVFIYPNPVTSDASIFIQSGTKHHAEITLLDVEMKRCRELYNGSLVSGENVISLKRTDNSLAPGIYFVRIRTEAGSVVKKVVLM